MTPADFLAARVAELDDAIALIENEGEEASLGLLRARRGGLVSALATLAADAPEPHAEALPSFAAAIARFAAAAGEAARDANARLEAAIDAAKAQRNQVALAETAEAIAAQHHEQHEADPAGVQRIVDLMQNAEAEPTATSPQSEAVAEPEPPTTPPCALDEASRYSPERKALIAQLWGNMDLTLAQVAERVNALPGPPIPSAEALRQGVRRHCDLPTSRLSYADQLAAERAATAPVAAPTPATPASEAGPAQASALPSRPARGPRLGAELPAEPKDKAEAVKLLEAGMSGRAVADEMGLPLSTVANWAAEVRLKQRASQAAKASAA